MKAGPTGWLRQIRVGHVHEVGNDGDKRQRRNDAGTDIMDDAAGAPAHVFEADRHRQAGIDVKGDFGEPGRRLVHVAAA